MPISDEAFKKILKDLSVLKPNPEIQELLKRLMEKE